MSGELSLSTITIASAAIPLVALLTLILLLRVSAAEAAGVSFGLAVVLAAFVFGASIQTMGVAVAKGIWDGFFVLLVIWPALLLFETVDNAGAFTVLRSGLERFTRNRLILILMLGWLSASFLQSVAGFGTPIAIVAPILIGLGVRPVAAVVIPLLGQAWANVFGSLGVPWYTLMRVVQLEDPGRTALYAAGLVWISNLAGALLICWLFARGRGVLHALPFVAIVSAIHGIGQALIAPLAPPVASLIPSVVALGVGTALALLPKYRCEDGLDTKIMQPAEQRREKQAEGALTFWKALVPYAVLVSVSLIVLLVPPVRETLESVQVGIPVPQTETSFGVVREAEQSYGAVSPLTHPGVFLLLSAVVGFALFRRHGAYGEHSVQGILADVARSALPASLSVLALLSLSSVMDAVGMVPVLATAIAAAATPTIYAALSNVIGALGTFMTSSTTASNILFGPLQHGSAVRLGLDESLIIGAQAAGAGAADAIGPANIVLGTGTAKIAGQEAEVLERTIPWLLVTSVLIAAATVLLAVLLSP